MTQPDSISPTVDAEELAPRIWADIIIDGEVRVETVERHLKSNNRVQVLLGCGAALLLATIGAMFYEGAPPLEILGQVGILVAFGLTLQHIRTQRVLLRCLLDSITRPTSSGPRKNCMEVPW